MDLLVGQENGRIYFTQFQGLDPDSTPVYTQAVPIQQRNSELSVGSAAMPDTMRLERGWRSRFGSGGCRWRYQPV